MTARRATEPEIRAVLDRSALQSYLRGHIHVGELMHECADEEGVFVAIPTTALAEASASYAEDAKTEALLRLITTLPAARVLDLDRDSALAMAKTLPLAKGDLSRAHAVWAANKYRALYFTTEPDEVTSLVPADNIQPIPSEDA